VADPLTEVVTLLQPSARLSKLVSGAGAWCVRRSEDARPFYCVILEGNSFLEVDGHEAIDLQAGDFVLIPSAYGFTMSGIEPAARKGNDPLAVTIVDGETRHGIADGPPNARLLVGYCTFGSPDSTMLVSLLPKLVHVRGQARLATLVQMVTDESRDQRPGREAVLSRLLEVLLIEALRCTAGSTAPAGLLRGLADERLALAIRRMHEAPTRTWTVAELAKEAALSRTTFFERFNRAVGVSPMEYLLAWRMTLAKDLLGRRQAGIAEIAERVGYSSASTFNVAFRRHVGVSPGRYARQHLPS
jgi:AraC-like DNA-binding protein